jgi:fumarylacetoacetate (FAA) hydrolase
MDFEADVAVVVGDVPRGVTPEDARGAIRLVMLANDVSLRGLIPTELSKGFGFFQSKPAGAFSPVAVTPDALEGQWDGAKLKGEIEVYLNGEAFGRTDPGIGMTFDFGVLIAHAARTRSLSAGSIIGSGAVSNPGEDGGPGRPVAAGGRGFSCIAELRTVETLETGAPRTGFLKWGDEVRIEMRDQKRRSLFGAIEQTIADPTLDAVAKAGP